MPARTVVPSAATVTVSPLRSTSGSGHEIDATDERRDELRSRTVIEILRGAFLDDAALAHHRDPVGHRHRFLLIVRDVDRRDREAALQLANFRAHLHPQLGVEIGQRLVEQQHARSDDDGARERDALLLAARQLAGELMLVAAQARPAPARRRRCSQSRCRPARAPASRRRHCRTPTDAGTARSSGTRNRYCAGSPAGR